MKYDIALITGDGIGPEQAAAAKKILETISDRSQSTRLAIKEVEAGDGALKKYGAALPDFTVQTIKGSQACLKGPVGESAADVIIVLRRMFDLYANVRPAKSYPNIPALSGAVDMVTVRENTEDVYMGLEFNLDPGMVVGLRVTTERASRRIAEYAFRTAEIRDNKRRVVAVHKANVMRKGDGLFASVCREVAKNHPRIAYSELYVDAAAMNLIRNPEDFDVIVTTNLFGDILSDEAAQVVGGLGMGPAANIGDQFALFEPVHGAAFDIAGKNAANPSSILLSAKMMLEWLADRHGDQKAADEGKRIEDAIVSLLKQNKKTKDIGGTLSTTQFTELVAREMYPG
ncbi:isocitrate/isopropylmalate dehydrogenase family protein [Nitrososphaera sp.]|uniref:isocitrate/isopropylmalate dehydrogenase family protein n=1 Tax=Nitrososphaera sp. TaxID=1971748 RepID=UPI00307EEAB2